MKRFRAAIANTRLDLQGEQFSPEALEQLAASPLPIPVTVGFDVPVGDVTELRVEGEELIAQGNIKGDTGSLVPVVGYAFRKGGGWMELKAVGLVEPDRAVTPNTWIRGVEDETAK